MLQLSPTRTYSAFLYTTQTKSANFTKSASGKPLRTESKTDFSVRTPRSPPYLLRLTKAHSWFVPAAVEDIKIDFLLDTGAECTLIHERKWKEIRKKNALKYELQPSNMLEMADGSGMEVVGEFKGDITIGTSNFTGKIIVAKLGRLQGVLGLDFLEKAEATINLQSGEVDLPTQTVIMHKNNAPQYCKISVQETYRIPSGSEILVEGHVKVPHGKEQECVSPTIGEVEGLKSWQKKGIRVARSVVSPKGNRIPLSVINLSDGVVTLAKGETVGWLCPIVGLIKVTDPDADNTLETTEKEKMLPEHIQPLLDECRDVLASDQLLQLSQFLGKYQDMFASPNGDLGVTHLVEHSIDTGNAAPIKQAPYRPAFAKREVAETEIKRMLKENLQMAPGHLQWSS